MSRNEIEWPYNPVLAFKKFKYCLRQDKIHNIAQYQSMDSTSRAGLEYLYCKLFIRKRNIL